MKEQFLEYEDALALRELGFDEPCFGHWVDGTLDLITRNINDYPPMYVEVVKAPLYQQAFKWFREKYQLHSTITSVSQESWQWHITKPGESLGKLYDEDFYTYEEAQQACIKQLIKLAKNESQL